jgi:hypothetical protein
MTATVTITARTIAIPAKMPSMLSTRLVPPSETRIYVTVENSMFTWILKGAMQTFDDFHQIATGRRPPGYQVLAAREGLPGPSARARTGSESSSPGSGAA